ncbi:hypothetical protein ACOMHN_046091 [Nucella lapillus]
MAGTVTDSPACSQRELTIPDSLTQPGTAGRSFLPHRLGGASVREGGGSCVADSTSGTDPGTQRSVADVQKDVVSVGLTSQSPWSSLPATCGRRVLV